jgi:hypothetical protein
VVEELSNIENTIGLENLQKLQNFWENLDGGYNDKILEEHGMLELWNTHKSDYADYLLGIKIRDCIKEHGECSFTAEL